jgi:hypothetical protein
MSLHLSYEDCYNIALKYSVKKEFRLSEPKVYSYAVRNNWFQDYTWLKRSSKIEHLYEKCCQEARKYTNVTEFQEQNNEQYQIAVKYRWLKQFDWLEDTSRYDTCYKIAQKYTTLKDLRLKDRSTYVIAIQNDWLKDYTWLQRKNKTPDYKWSINEYAEKYSYENCFIIAQKYKSIREFKEDNFICYNKCRRNDWLKDYTWLEDDTQGNYQKLTYDECYEIAKQCTSKTEMRETYWSAFRKASDEQWLNDYTWFKSPYMTQKNNFCVYSYEDKDKMTVYIGLTKDIQRRHRQHTTKVPCKDYYDRVKTYFLEQGKELPMYDILSDKLSPEEAQFYESFWIETYKIHGWSILNKAKTGKGKSSLGSYTKKWTKDVCLKKAKKYQTLLDFMLQDNGAYQACCRNGWIKEITWTQRNKTFSTKPVPIVEVDEQGSIVNYFASKTEAMKQCGLTLHTMRNALELNERLKNGNFLRKACTLKKI